MYFSYKVNIEKKIILKRQLYAKDMDSLVFTFLLCLQKLVTSAAHKQHVHQIRAEDFLSTTDNRTLPYIENRNIDTPSLEFTYRQSQTRQHGLVKE